MHDQRRRRFTRRRFLARAGLGVGAVPLTGRARQSAPPSSKERDVDAELEVRPTDPEARRLEIGMWMMESGEHRGVATRLAEVLRERAG